ncbi:hypothetical protein Vafri_17156 [Volvox africanus]|uniref:Uncharacterized protein n=1 Tax=Volvox africanus TaxID=51714 RepID=A0A8J4BJL9_9CHLO|nr:hypothetical protein Vafri_17156 [Volvox africanus]
MMSMDQAGAAGGSFFAQSSKTGARTLGIENRSSGNLCITKIVDLLASNASSGGLLKPLPAAKPAPIPDSSSPAVLHTQGDLIAVKSEDADADSAMPTLEASGKAASSQLYAPGKRTSSQAFSGDAAATQIHPTLPRRPRWLPALPVGLGEDVLSYPSHGTGSQHPYQVPSFLRAGGQVNTEFQPSLEVLEQLQEFMGAARTESQSNGDTRERSPEFTSTLPAAPANMSSVLNGLNTSSSGKLSAFLCGTSPAVLEQLIAAALVGRTAASASAPASDQAQVSLVAASHCSPESVDGAAMQSKSLGSQHVHREESQFAEPGPTRRLQVAPDASLDLSSRVSASTVKGQERVGVRTTADVCGAARGSASGSADDVSLTVPASDQAAGRGSGLSDEAGCGGAKDDDGRGCGKGIESGVSKLVGPGRSGNSNSAPGDPTGTMRPAPAAVLQPSIAWDFPARAPNLVGDSATGPAAQRVSTAPSDPPSVQASEPVSVQLGAAIPPELAARLKKPVRIIQPISQTWVEETLQCASGVTGPPASTSKASAAASLWPTSSRGKHCPSTVMVGSALAPAVGYFCGTGMTSSPTAGSLPSSGTVAVVRETGPSQRVGTAPLSSVPAAARAMPSQPSALRGTSARATRLASVTVGTQAQQTASQPSWNTLKPQTLVTGPSAGEQPQQLAALAPALTTLPPADYISPFTASSASHLLPPQHQATSPPTGGSAVAAVLLPAYESNATAVSTTWAVGTSPLSSSFGPGCSIDALVAEAGPALAAAAVDVGPTATAALHDGEGPLGTELDIPSSGRTTSALPGSSVPAGSQEPARGAALSQPDVLHGPLNDRLVATQRPQQAAPSPSLPQQKPSATTSAGTTSASCLGKVQGELTLLYQWYAANKAVYLDQAQRQLQRIEMLTAAHEEAAGSGTAAAASAKAESGEAMRAFETALKIMSVCGRVEQQWLSAAGSAGAGADSRQIQVPAPPLRRQGSMQQQVADASGAPFLAADMALAGSAMDVAIHGTSAASAPLPSTGWAHGASAALAVAAALVGSVSQGQRPARGSSGMVSGSLAVRPAGAGTFPQAAGRGANPRPVVGSGQTIGLPLSRAAQDLLAAAGTAAACASWPPPALVVTPSPPSPTMAAPRLLVMQPPPSPPTAAAPLSPPIGPRRQATPA